MMRIVKLGGSCYKNLKSILNELEFASKITEEPIYIIPGGWIYADMVRSLDMDDNGSHWLAISSMEVYGITISSLFNLGSNSFDSFNCRLKENLSFPPMHFRDSNIINPEDFGSFSEEIKGVKVILPYRLLRKYDELPHSWETTSDSISVWLAHKLDLDEVIKLTDVDGVYMDGELIKEIYATELEEKSCIDRNTPVLIQKYSVNMFICNGFKARVKDYILRGRAVGTLIKAHLNDNRT